MPPTTLLSRRQLVALGLSASVYSAAVPGETHQATGCKVGEMTPESATLWTRRTAASQPLINGIVRRGQGPDAKYLSPEEKPELLERAAPGAPGWVRVRYNTTQSTQWQEADPAADFTTQFDLKLLKPAQSVDYVIETSATRNGRIDGELTGRFRTLPLPTQHADVQIAMLSCQMFCHMDRPDGFQIYRSIQTSNPDFLLSCGDNVYYDNEDPIAANQAIARYHWQRMYGLPTIADCLQNIGAYWQKDDHDVLSDDAWPTLDDPKMKALTFQQGQQIFRQQVPAPKPNQPMYRTVKYGRDLELWLPESRDYRSVNTAPDGPAKSIWGKEQKQWLMTTVKASNAKWKVIVNPNPIVGPDRKSKKDNHSNAAYATESLEFRSFLKNHGNVISVCGDRHWQYHSIDPLSGLHEFGCGAASDEHAGGTPGFDKDLHQFHRVQGGYLTMQLKAGHLTLRHHDVLGAAVHQYNFAAK